MNRTVQQITQRLVDHLPENAQYYRPDELRTWGFPSFMVRRIKIELQRNLEESLMIPQSDWANIRSEAVQRAWQKFVDAIRAEARLPASYAKAVIETAVADVLEMLVQPRKSIPEVVFGADDSLRYQQVVNRSRAIVVYPHFSSLLTRYMQKKNLKTLSRQQGAKVVAEADKKITARYSPLNWAQMLEPLFKLMDNSIDTDLLRLFFEDKNMPRIARQFDLMDNSVNRAELIEILSSPDLLNFEGYKDDQANLFDVKPKKKSQRDKPATRDEAADSPDPTEESGESNLQQSVDWQPFEEEETNHEEEVDGDKLQNLFDEGEDKNEDESYPADTAYTEPDFEETDSEISVEEDEAEDDNSINAVFARQEEPVEDAEERERPEPVEQRTESDKEEEIVGVEKEEKDESPSVEEEERPEDARNGSPEETESEEESREAADENESEESEDNEEETPMWMRYMTDEEVEEYQRRQQGESEEESKAAADEHVDEDGFIDEPIIDLTREKASNDEIEILKNQLSDDREAFVEDIFNGSERAYDEAVEEIAAYDNWRDVSRYIEKDIFKRNLVNMYSEPAVDFTDRLQSYFLEKQNRNR